MSLALDDSHGALRRVVYCLLIITSTAAMAGRVLSVKSARGRTPLLGANDRSRWCTVRAIVDEGTYSIDNVLFTKSGERDREWYTIDMVRHKGSDGREHYYSSKPPLFPTLVAGKYWLVKQATGATLASETSYVVRLLLITTNVLPMVVYFLLLAQLVERLGETDWGRVFAVGAATWGTFLTTFAVVINNHVPAAISVLVAVYASFRIMGDGRSRLRWYALAGLSASFAAANELPALSFLALVGLVLFWRSPARTLAAFVPAASLVAAGFFGTNNLAHGSWRPPYAHRRDGPVVATLPSSVRDSLQSGRLSADQLQPLAAAGIRVSSEARVTPGSRQGRRWVLWDPKGQNRFAIVDAGGGFQVRAWDNWYEYEESYWTSPGKKRGVDLGEPSRAVYAFHVLLGHHGVFSLTPLWLLSVVGIGLWGRRGDAHLRAFAAMVMLLTVVCLVFYIMLRPPADLNYGGVSCGFRWMFWFTPLWLICLVPAVDVLSRRRSGRLVAWLLLLVSIVSASYASLNPWSHPWIFDYWTDIGWIRY